MTRQTVATKTLLASGLVLLFAVSVPSIPSSAFAEWGWNHPVYATFATRADLDSLSGLAGSEPIAVAVDTDGSLLVIDDPAGSVGKVIDVNPGGGANGTVVADESLLTAATPDAADADLDVDRILVASSGAIYIAEHQGDDDVLRLTRGGSPAATSIAVVNGLVDLALDLLSNRLFLPLEVAFGAAADDVRMIELSGGATSIAATETQIRAATGTAGTGMTACVALPNGNLAFFDEAFYSGADGVCVLANPGPSPSISLWYATAFFPSAPGLSNLVVTPEGDLFGWNQNPASGTPNLTIIPHTALGPADVIEIGVDAIKTGLGIPSGDVFQPDRRGSLAVRHDAGPPGRIVLYLAESRNQHAVFTMTINEYTPEVGDWPLY